MKSYVKQKMYVKQVEALAYQGSPTELKKFLGEDAIEITAFEEGLSEVYEQVTLTTATDKWNVVMGDYIVKDFKGISVYKASRFEEEFQEVTFEDEMFVNDNGENAVVSTKDFDDYKKEVMSNPASIKESFTKEEQSKSKDIAATKPTKKAADKKE